MLIEEPSKMQEHFSTKISPILKFVVSGILDKTFFHCNESYLISKKEPINQCMLKRTEIFLTYM